MPRRNKSPRKVKTGPRQIITTCDTDQMTFAELVKAFMQAREINGDKLANWVNTSPATISRVTHEGYMPKLDIGLGIISKLKIPMRMVRTALKNSSRGADAAAKTTTHKIRFIGR